MAPVHGAGGAQLPEAACVLVALEAPRAARALAPRAATAGRLPA